MEDVIKKSIKNLRKINNIKNPKIKIFGERNSGTIFLTALIRNNFKNIHICNHELNGGTGWKHGIPNNFYLDKIKGKVIYIVIFRELISWLNSMYNRPYHIHKRSNFYEFIISKIKSKTGYNCDVKYFPWETSNNPFQLRYFKYNELKKLFLKKDNVVFVNLGWLQKDKGQQFINLLSEKYELERSFTLFNPVLKHTKTQKKTDNDKSYKKYKIPPSVFKKYVNPIIENEINNLTFMIK